MGQALREQLFDDRRALILEYLEGETLDFELPELPERQCWARLVDTGWPFPEALVDPPQLLFDGPLMYLTEPRSTVALVKRNVPAGENEA